MPVPPPQTAAQLLQLRVAPVLYVEPGEQLAAHARSEVALHAADWADPAAHATEQFKHTVAFCTWEYENGVQALHKRCELRVPSTAMN